MSCVLSAGRSTMTKISDNDPDRAKGADSDFPEPGGSPEHSGEDREQQSKR